MAEAALCLSSSFTCIDQLERAVGSASGSIRILAAVGEGSPPRVRNAPSDVKTIQQALNQFSALQGGPLHPLASDGFCGTLTRQAIVRFQRKWSFLLKGSKVPDGIVDVEGETIAQLRKGPGGITDLPIHFASKIRRVLEIVTATRASLSLAQHALAMKQARSSASNIHIGEAEVTKLERHFHISKTADGLARARQIESVFLDMQTAIGHIPRGVIVAADQPPENTRSAFMFCFQGGYSRRSPNDKWQGLHKGSIYLCPAARGLSNDQFVYSMVHELAHYTSPVKNGIKDAAYFHISATDYRKLTAERAFHNADSYAQFAYEVIGKPDFRVD